MVSRCVLLRCVLTILATDLPQAFYSPCFFRRQLQLAGHRIRHRHHPSYSTSLFASKKWQPHFLESFVYDGYTTNMAGHLLFYPQEGTREKLKEQHEQNDEELRIRDLSVFQDCEIQNVMMCIQTFFLIFFSIVIIMHWMMFFKILLPLRKGTLSIQG